MKNITAIEKTRLDKNWKWCKNYWNRKSKDLKLENWSFIMNHTKTSLAICNYTKKKICVSSYFLRGNAANEKTMRNAILHEAAHALAGAANGHNAKWKKVALSIGCDGKTRAIMDKPKGEYLMFCPKGCFKQEYYRKPNLDGKVCLKCKSSPKLKKI